MEDRPPPVPDDDTILPRRYQEEIFQKAQNYNVIAALDTGSGKTFISTMLIRWITSREAAHGKVVIFLVPKVPLVEQQADFIAKRTPLRVCKLHGMLGADLTDRAAWRNTFEQHDVFVLTGTCLFFSRIFSVLFTFNSMQLRCSSMSSLTHIGPSTRCILPRPPSPHPRFPIADSA
jgi:superfamily II DNA or RNA helicase